MRWLTKTLPLRWSVRLLQVVRFRHWQTHWALCLLPSRRIRFSLSALRRVFAGPGGRVDRMRRFCFSGLNGKPLRLFSKEDTGARGVAPASLF